MFDTLVYYGIPIVFGASAALLVAVIAGVIVWRFLPTKKDTHPMGAYPLWRPQGGFPPRPQEPIADEDDVDGSFTCFFCDTPYVFGAEDCICYGCNRYICLNCTDYEESQTPGGPDGLHMASDHPAIVFKIKMED